MSDVEGNKQGEALQEEQQGESEVGGRYAHYVLFVLILVYIFNFVDRNILSILAEDIKADLGISDAQMGFLYGTVFAVFYAVFGIPLARFADVFCEPGFFTWQLVHLPNPAESSSKPSKVPWDSK